MELVISVAVILILSSLLLPAVHRTRERADRTRCLENQRQLLLGWSLFAADHQGMLPANGHTPAGGSRTRLRWVQGNLNPLVAPADLFNDQLLINPAYAQLAPYITAASVYRCPTEPEPIRSYAMNAYVGWDGPEGRWLTPGYRVFRNTADFTALGPARSLVFSEVRPESLCWPFFGVSMATGAGEQLFAFPAVHHGGGAQLGFADGHVELRKWRDVRTLRPGNVLFHAHDTPSPNNADLAWLRSVATIRRSP